MNSSCGCDCVRCSSNVYEANSSMPTTASDDDNACYYYFNFELPLAFHVTVKARHISGYLTGPLALVTNGLSLIVFARMYRAKQQVITVAMIQRYTL